MGMMFALVGAMLAKRWQFSEHLVDCIRDHHNPDAAPTAMMDCLRMANQIARKMDVGDSGNPWRETEEPAAPGRFAGGVDATIAELGDLQRFIDDANTFAQVSSNR